MKKCKRTSQNVYIISLQLLKDEWGLFNRPGKDLDEINPDEIFDKLSEDEDDEEDWWKNNDED